ncbi:MULTISPECIES: PadR family transcriptional regulator [Nocardiopsis]|uniref:PadR family transcriptional regulator n=1 Tax=Nocardiopsis sinuspersici TaxID=501010 RepID=A0A1V3C9D6_9ACTN|nr:MULTISPECIES: PadR family transcriptional regulator [Nocardiopsis]OOC57313.1 PadR family transcriptional regulator [Nocardiopsis sinuspersici]
MSATRLLVLGVVRMEGQAHGYRVGRALLSWGAEEWANIKWGSIYHALRKLSQEGKLREFVAEGDEVVDRTSYSITEDGVAEIHRLLRRGLTRRDDPAMLFAAVTLMTSLPRGEVVDLLRRRLELLEKTSGELLPSESRGEPGHVRELFNLWRGTIDADIQWTRNLIASLRAGEYTMADDAPDAFGLPPAES